MPGNYGEYGLKSPEHALQVLESVQNRQDWQRFLDKYAIPKKNDRWNVFHLLTAVTERIEKNDRRLALSGIDIKLLHEVVRLNLLFHGNCEKNRTGRYAVERLKAIESSPSSEPFETPLAGQTPERSYIPIITDFEESYQKVIGREGQEVSVEIVLDQFEADARKMGKRLHPQWRSIIKNKLPEWLNDNK